jgi:hypothetical protein
MTNSKLPQWFLKRLEAVTNKRPRIVIAHILKHGFITTEELETKYGYKHPPRAARDVREEGIPLESFNVKNAEGRTIAAYRFADLSKVRKDKVGGRKVFWKGFKRSLIEAVSCQCSVCSTAYEERYLQIDHRIPYEVYGDANAKERNVQEYMLLCGSCNRAKSWSCEHCVNWREDKLLEVCNTCYWAMPESYKHIALRLIRRLDVVWTEKEVEIYEKLRKRAESVEEPLPEYVKAVLALHLK